jgi:hypothetical protein
MKDMYVVASRTTIIGSGLIGFVSGALAWGISLVLQKYFIEPIFCHSVTSFGICSNGGTYAFNTALIIAAIVAVIALVRVEGYRPLLVAIATVATLWSANTWLGVQSWWEATLWMALLSALAYLVYSWIARIVNFPVSVVLMVLVVVAARLIIATS